MDKEIEGTDVAVGAVGSEGERRSSTLSTAQDDGAVAALALGQRWSLSRKREVVLRLMQGEPAEGLSRRLCLPVWKLERWRLRALAGIEAGLRERDDDPKERELAEAHRRVGELSMENELLRARLEKPGPLARRRSR
jgi:transposase